MGKQERQGKAAQDLKDRLGVDAAQMTPEQFASAVDAYIGQRLREAESGKTGAQANEREYAALRGSLVEIATDSRNTPSQRLRAVEHLAALPEIFERLQWAWVF